MKIIVGSAALADLARLHTFLAQKDLTAARRAHAILIRAIGSLDAFPNRGRLSVPPDVRELIVPFGASAFLLRYAYHVESNEIVILRVWHSREVRD